MITAPLRRPADDLKRSVLLTIFALSWVSSNIGWWFSEVGGRSSPALRLVFAVNVFFHPIMAAIVWMRRVPLVVVDYACLCFAAGICALCLALRFYSPTWGAAFDLQPLYLWLPVIYVFAFTLPDHRASLRVSLAMLTVFVLISLPHVFGHYREPETNATVQVHLVSSVLITALYFFSSYVHRYRDAQLTVEEVARLANTDPLTKLANRRRISEEIDHELARFTRYGHPFSIVVFDVDHFKDVNDRFGHRVGDQLLVALAERAREGMREVDTLGRWGGEEFLVILPETDFDETLLKATALCQHIASTPLASGTITAGIVTISGGVATVTAGDTLDTLVHRADVALYTAKRNGRNRAEGSTA